VEVLLVPDVLLVDHVGVHSLPRVLPLQDVAVALNTYIVRFGTRSIINYKINYGTQYRLNGIYFCFSLHLYSKVEYQIQVP
jgi:hypothetical protein